MHSGLAEALDDIRALGFTTGLHSSGAYPKRLADLLSKGLLDWVGLDIKAPKAIYPLITGRQNSGEKAFGALKILVASGVDYEVRTTLYKPVLTDQRLAKLGHDLFDHGVKNLVLQAFVTPSDAEIKPSEFHDMAEKLASVCGPVQVRV
jgi:pyruvate formate lyase activating enzyme